MSWSCTEACPTVSWQRMRCLQPRRQEVFIYPNVSWSCARTRWAEGSWQKCSFFFSKLSLNDCPILASEILSWLLGVSITSLSLMLLYVDVVGSVGAVGVLACMGVCVAARVLRVLCVPEVMSNNCQRSLTQPKATNLVLSRLYLICWYKLQKCVCRSPQSFDSHTRSLCQLNSRMRFRQWLVASSSRGLLWGDMGCLLPCNIL